MTAALTIAHQDPASAPESAARRCLATGETRPKAELIRFVIAPDKTIIPDLSQNLPGRGLWVSAARAAIETAIDKNLFAKAAKSQVKVDPRLFDLVVQLLRKRCLDFLGLARSAGLVVPGQSQVEPALKANKIDLLLVAPDASSHGLEKLSKKPVAVFQSLTRDELGRALGHDQLVYIGLKAHNLTEKLHLELTRLEKISGQHHLSLAMNG